jgi:hypothetical protein
MLDGRGAHNFEFYFHRASLSPSRPACIGLRLGAGGQRLDVFRDMEQRGLTTLMYLGTRPIDAIPDSADLTLDEIKTMPKYIQSLKCNGKLENGEPTCADAKWNMNGGECDSRPFKTSWHPGWYARRNNAPELELLFAAMKLVHSCFLGSIPLRSTGKCMHWMEIS